MSLRRLVLSALALAGLMVCCANGARAVEADARNAALMSITTEEAKDVVDKLSDDTFEGRESGTRGGRAAAGYIVDRLKKMQAQGGGPKGSYFQPFGNYNNILVFVEGRDPVLKDQVIIVGAHYDHVGYGNARNSFGPTGFIHNGADDNASGVAALLEVAEAIHMLPEHPKRSLLLAFWDGEEKGLLGSKHWVENPTIPLKQVALAINADMVGRLRKSLDVFGIRTSAGLRKLISRQNEVSQLPIDFHWEVKPDSDHYSFYSRDIPFIMVFTGMHGDYHRPSDDAEKINAEGIKQIAQLIFNVAVELGEVDQIGPFRRKSRQESRADQLAIARPLAPPPGRLGLTWDEPQAAEGKIVVVGVAPGSAADKAGVRRGDRLLKLADRDVNDAREFRLGVLAAGNETKLVVQRAGEEEPRELDLNLPGAPVRLGVSWRTDECEPGTVVLTRLTPGSPADLAGLRPGDIVHRIGGQDFTSSDQFRQLSIDLPDPLILEVETGGKVRSVEIPTPAVAKLPGPADDEKSPGE